MHHHGQLKQQDNSTYRPIAYRSRLLSETEMKFTQIEKESSVGMRTFPYVHPWNILWVGDRSLPLGAPLQGKGKQPDKQQPEMKSGNYTFKSTTSRCYTIWEETTWPTLSRLPTPAPRSNMEACTNMDQEGKSHIKCCHPCQATSRPPNQNQCVPQTYRRKDGPILPLTYAALSPLVNQL